MTIVSNTSPIINLAAIDRLDLLEKLYGKVIIPRAVYNEITVTGEGQPGDREVRTFDWIEVVDIKDTNLLTALKTELHAGEAEAIVLAIEKNSDLLLLDERRARNTASKFALRHIGLLGILVQAKQKAYIPEVKPLLDNLMSKAGFWISRKLYRYILKKAGE